MPRVTLYTTSWCPYCVGAKRLLGQHGVPYEEIDVSHDDAQRIEMARRADGRWSVPQIFIDGDGIGGYTELRDLADDGRLAKLG